jgi:hypothetical protein
VPSSHCLIVRIVGLARVGRRRRVGGGGRGERRKKRFSSCESFERIKEVFGSKNDDKNLDRMINQRVCRLWSVRLARKGALSDYQWRSVACESRDN